MEVIRLKETLNMIKVITLKDIADKTGFTINTVSRALKDKDDISQVTKTLIQSTANEMGYIGNTLAGSLRSGTSKTIAVILGDISNPYFSIITKEIERKASSYGYCVLILNTEEDTTLERESILSVLSKKVDGIIISPCQKNLKNIDFLKMSGIPFVLLGRHFANKSMNYVICDDINGGYMATQHLIDKGHKKILFLNGPTFLSPAKERYAGYRNALKKNGIPFRLRLVKETNVITGNSRDIIRQAIDEKLDFTAILAFSDLVALETICALQNMGKKVPEDVSIVGFDNIQSNFIFPYSLTSVDTPKVEIAHNAVSILLKNIKDRKSEFCNTIISNKLIERGSTAECVVDPASR
jgi:LacI family transcriptional regulator